jgi:hypothetical protein
MNKKIYPRFEDNLRPSIGLELKELYTYCQKGQS